MYTSNSRRQRFLKRGTRGLTVATNKPTTGTGTSSHASSKKSPSPPPQDTVSPHSTSSSGHHSNGSNGIVDRFRRRKNGKKKLLASSSVSNLPLSPPTELGLKLMPRIADYKRRGIISAREEQTYLQLLESRGGNDAFGGANDNNAAAAGESPALHVERLLEEAYKQYHVRQQQTASSQFQQPTFKRKTTSRSLFRKMMGPSTAGGDDAPLAETELGVLHSNHSSSLEMESPPVRQEAEQQGKAPASPIATERTFTSTSRMTTNSIVETQQVWDSDVVKNEDELEKLFVEMCFFARLGFVQPPSCLCCVYQETMEKKKSSEDCQKWVVWRKNARTLLHPNRLDENLVLVKCCAARKLIEGEAVEAHEWDSMRRQLVYHM